MANRPAIIATKIGFLGQGEKRLKVLEIVLGRYKMHYTIDRVKDNPVYDWNVNALAREFRSCPCLNICEDIIRVARINGLVCGPHTIQCFSCTYHDENEICRYCESGECGGCNEPKIIRPKD